MSLVSRGGVLIPEVNVLKFALVVELVDTHA